MSAQIRKEWVLLLLLLFGGQECFHVECVLLHHQQAVENVDTVRLEDV